jgi:hypothetical protein
MNFKSTQNRSSYQVESEMLSNQVFNGSKMLTNEEKMIGQKSKIGQGVLYELLLSL